MNEQHERRQGQRAARALPLAACPPERERVSHGVAQ